MKYDPNASHYQIVWPVGAPPVQTFNWDNEDWLKYCRSFRPVGYTGGEFDKAAYAAWVENNAKKIRDNFFARLNTEADRNPPDRG